MTEKNDQNAKATADCAPMTCSARPSKCPQCGESIVQTNLGNGQTDDYCEECGWPDENREAYIPPGELKITYAKLQQVIKECRSQIESAPGEPPDGYDVDNKELTEVADASWEKGMSQLSSALLNWAYDELQAPNADFRDGGTATPRT